MPRHDDTVTLRPMLDYALTAHRLAAGFARRDLDANEMLRLALTRAVEVIGEASARVSPARQQKEVEIPWAQLIGLCNRLIHGYDAINHDILWDIATLDIPPLIERLTEILSSDVDDRPPSAD